MSTVRIDFEIGSGQCNTTIVIDNKKEWIPASYISDAVGDLLAAFNRILEGSASESFSWWEEPGEYRWRFTRQGSHLSIRILSFKETFGSRPDAEGYNPLVASCGLNEFGIALKKALSRVSALLSPTEYKKEWDYEFPDIEYRKLQKLLKQRGIENI